MRRPAISAARRDSVPEAKLTAASAISYIDSKDPPVLMIHGVNDHTVPIDQSRAYLAALRARGSEG